MKLIRRTDTAYRLRVAMDSRLPKSDQMVLSEPVCVELLAGQSVTIPAGFVTDCHSTPRLLAALLPEYDNRTNVAAIVHDYLYMHWAEFADYSLSPTRRKLYGNGPAARLYADDCYLALMNQFHSGGWRNRLYYKAVRLFGGFNWRRFRRTDEAALNQALHGTQQQPAPADHPALGGCA